MAQQSRANLKALKNTRFPTNGIGLVTAETVRNHGEDEYDSFVFKTDDISTNSDFDVDGTKLTDRATIKTLVEGGPDKTWNNFFKDEHFNYVSLTPLTNMGWVGLNNGGSTVVAGTTDAEGGSHTTYGIVNMSTGTGTDYAAFQETGKSIQTGTSHNVLWRARVVTLSDGTDTYIAYIGIMSNIDIGSANPPDAACFRYTHGENSGRWLAVSRDNGGTEETTDTGVTVDTNYHEFRVIVDRIADEVLFYIDGSLVATHTTIPVTTTTRPHCRIRKTAGTTARKMLMDYVSIKYIVE